MDQDTVARSQIDALRTRVEQLERMIREIYDRSGWAMPGPMGEQMAARTSDDLDPEVLSLLQQGNMIAAIKTYRQITGLDLASAKAALEREAAARGL